MLIKIFYCYSSAVIGEIDDDTDSSLDMANIRADPLNPVVYWTQKPVMGNENGINGMVALIFLHAYKPTGFTNPGCTNILKILLFLRDLLRDMHKFWN